MEMTLQDSLLTVNGALLIVVVYFAKNLVNQITNTSKSLGGLDKSVAILSEKMDNYTNQFKHMYKFEERVEAELKEVREVVNDLSHKINKVDNLCTFGKGDKECK